MSDAPAGRPLAGVPRPYRFPRFERQRSHAVEVDVITAPVAKLPLVTIVALIDAGAARDPVGGEGLAVLTAKLLMEGTERHDGAALVDAFEQLGASVDVSAGWDSAAVTLTVLAHHVSPALLLLSEVIRHPAFRERDVSRLKAERAAELLQMRADPRALADESFGRLLYSSASRYAYPEAGGSRAVAGITRDDITTFFRDHYTPDRLTIIVAGDVTHELAREMVNEAFADWTGRAGSAIQATDEATDETRRIQIITKADAPQSELRVGHRGVPRNHPDHFPLVVMNAILGGLFSSRINLNLREQHGYTYGAHSEFEWRRGAGPFVVATAVESGVTADATKEIVAELERIRTERVTEEELSLATSYLEGVFPIRYETTAAIAGALAALVIYGHPADYFDAYRPHIQAVTREDVLRVAREHLHPDRLLIVAIGDATAIEPSMAGLELGPVTVTAADNPATGA